MMRRAVLIAAAMLVAPAARAQASDLPLENKVQEALAGYPGNAAAAARRAAAQAENDMLRSGPHEFTLSGSYARRTIEREGRFEDYDATLSRAVRLPGKASLDRRAGALGVGVADSRLDDARHQAAVLLATLWYDWLMAAEIAETEARTVATHEAAVKAVRRRIELRDAAQLEGEQTDSALALAEAERTRALAALERARVLLAATFPEIPLPERVPAIAAPQLPPENDEILHGMIMAGSHALRAAEGETERLAVLARRARVDRLGDPTVGVRLFSERSGMEQGAGVVVSIPLGWGYRKGASDQASAQASAATFDLEQTRRAVDAEVRADVASTRARVAAWQSARWSAETAARAGALTERGYQAGETDLIDFLYAQRQAAEASRVEIRARAEAAAAVLKLKIDAHLMWNADHDSRK